MFTFNGKGYDVPGSYGVLKVISDAGANLPDFSVGLIVARSIKGIPYNLTKTGDVLMPAYSNTSDILRDFGDDNILRQYRYAQKHGAEVVFVCNVSPNTITTWLISDGSATTITMNSRPNWYGVCSNDVARTIEETASTLAAVVAVTPLTGTATAGASTTMTDSTATWGTTALVGKWVRITGGTGVGQTRKIASHTATVLTVAAWSTNPSTDSTYEIIEPKFTLTLLPPKGVKRLVETSGTDDTIYVNSIDGLSEGTTVYLQSNGHSAPESYVIKTIDTVRNTTKHGFKVVFTTNITTTATLANYARIFQEDNDTKEVIEWTGDFTVQKVVDVINLNSQIFEAVIAASSTLPATATKAYVQNTASATKGTDGSGGTEVKYGKLADFTTFADNFPKMHKEFEYINRVKIRNILIDSHDTSTQAIFGALEVNMRARRAPITVYCGTGWGETDTVSSTTANNPVTRAKALNSDGIVLCSGGAEYYPAALSFAPAIFGLVCANPVQHNLTRDLLNFTSVEKSWTEAEIVKLIKNGVMIYDRFPTGIRVVRGINTYQSQDHIWNEQDNKTYLIMPRNLADKFFRAVIEGLDADIIGNDRVTKKKVEQYVIKTGMSAKAAGEILEFQLINIDYKDGAFLPYIKIVVDEPTDFTGTTMYVVTPIPENLKTA